MSSTVGKRLVVAVSLAFAACTTHANDVVPKILQEPVLGLRYVTTQAKFDALPAEIIAKCPTMVYNANVQGRFWIYAFAQDAGRDYYIVGGYGERRNPEPPQFPRYQLYKFGLVFFLEGNQCTPVGEAQEVFDTGAFDEMTVATLRHLAADSASRLTRAFGGPNGLRAELRNQHIDLDGLPPELREAFKPFFKPAK